MYIVLSWDSMHWFIITSSSALCVLQSPEKNHIFVIRFLICVPCFQDAGIMVLHQTWSRISGGPNHWLIVDSLYFPSISLPQIPNITGTYYYRSIWGATSRRHFHRHRHKQRQHRTFRTLTMSSPPATIGRITLFLISWSSTNPRLWYCAIRRSTSLPFFKERK